MPNWAVKRTPTLAMANAGALRPIGLRHRLPLALSIRSLEITDPTITTIGVGDLAYVINPQSR